MSLLTVAYSLAHGALKHYPQILGQIVRQALQLAKVVSHEVNVVHDLAA